MSDIETTVIRCVADNASNNSNIAMVKKDESLFQ